MIRNAARGLGAILFTIETGSYVFDAGNNVTVPSTQTLRWRVTGLAPGAPVHVSRMYLWGLDGQQAVPPGTHADEDYTADASGIVEHAWIPGPAEIGSWSFIVSSGGISLPGNSSFNLNVRAAAAAPAPNVVNTPLSDPGPTAAPNPTPTPQGNSAPDAIASEAQHIAKAIEGVLTRAALIPWYMWAALAGLVLFWQFHGDSQK